jgi:hypothetical protein
LHAGFARPARPQPGPAARIRPIAKNPPGLNLGPAAESRWISSDGSPAKSREQKPWMQPPDENPNSFSPTPVLSLYLGSFFLISPKRKRPRPLRRPERRTAPPRSPWPVRALSDG